MTLKEKLKEKRINQTKEQIKLIDSEINYILEGMAEIEDLTSKEEYIKYGMLTKRLDEMTKIKVQLEDVTKKTKIDWATWAKIMVSAASICATVGLTISIRNSEMNNERILFRSHAYREVPKIPTPTSKL